MLPMIPSQTQTPSPATDPNRGFPTPWLDYTNVTLPDSHQMVLWWAQFMWLTNGNYRGAMERVAAHFVTQLEFPELEPDEQNNWRDLFIEHLNYRLELLAIAYDFLAYGNSFLTVYIPFRRFCSCRKCGFEQPISAVGYKLEFSHTAPYLIWRRTANCPACSDASPYKVFDRRDPDMGRVRINRFDPADIEIAQNRFSLRKVFYWKIPTEVREGIMNGARIHVDDTPMEVLEAVAVNGKLRFDDDQMLHHAEVNISGIHTRGWGIPRSISNFRSAWLQQQTNKLDQAVAIDYTMGLRLISPAPTAGGVDPLVDSGQQQFVSNMRRIIDTHRRNPATYHTTPHPVSYQFLGGEGATLLPFEKLKFRQQEFLSDIGVPLELHQMNLSTQAAPMMLRLFETYWQGMPAMYDRTLKWIVNLLSKAFALKPTRVVLQRSTAADDLERRQVLLQLMAGNQLSAETALRPFGVDAHDEAKKVMRQERYMNRLQREAEEQMLQEEEMGALRAQTQNPTPVTLLQQQEQQAAAQAAGGGAGGVMPPMGGAPGASPAPQSPKSLQGYSEQAAQIAQQLVVMPEFERKRELKAIRESNRDLHALVMQNLDELRRGAASEGKAMLLQQGGAPPA